LIIENKSVRQIEDVHMAQLMTYLKLTKISLGFILNFNTPHLKNGIKRIVL
jgi:GxxExxY protein